MLALALLIYGGYVVLALLVAVLAWRYAHARPEE